MEDRCECGCPQVWSDRHHMLLCVHCDLGRKPKKRAGVATNVITPIAIHNDYQ